MKMCIKFQRQLLNGREIQFDLCYVISIIFVRFGIFDRTHGYINMVDLLKLQYCGLTESTIQKKLAISFTKCAICCILLCTI